MFCKYCGAPSDTEVCLLCAAEHAQSRPQPQVQPQSQIQAQPQAQPQYRVQPEPQFQPQPQFQVQPEPQFQPQPQFQVQPEPQFQPQPQFQVQPEPQFQPQPQYQVQQQKPAADFLKLIKDNLHYIIVGVAALALIWGILNLFSVFHVNVKISAGRMKYNEYMSAYDLNKIAVVYIGNIFFGLACLGVAAIGALYFLKKFMNMPYYDRIIGERINLRPAFMMGVLGTGGALLQMFMYLFTIETARSGRASIGVNWTTWMMLVLFVGMAVVDKFILEEKNQESVQYENPPQYPMQ